MERGVVVVEVAQRRDETLEVERTDIKDLKRRIAFGIFLVDFDDELFDLLLFVFVRFNEDRAGRLVDNDGRLREHRHDCGSRDGKLRILQAVDARGHAVVVLFVELIDELRDLVVFVRFRENDDLVLARARADLDIRIEREQKRGELRERHAANRIRDKSFRRARALFNHFVDERANLLLFGGPRVNDNESGRRRRQLDRFGRDRRDRGRRVRKGRDRNIADIVCHGRIARLFRLFDVKFLDQFCDFRVHVFRRGDHEVAGGRGEEVAFARERVLAVVNDVGQAHVEQRIAL